jgi:hypothetical protein
MTFYSWALENGRANWMKLYQAEHPRPGRPLSVPRFVQGEVSFQKIEGLLGDGPRLAGGKVDAGLGRTAEWVRQMAQTYHAQGTPDALLSLEAISRTADWSLQSRPRGAELEARLKGRDIDEINRDWARFDGCVSVWEDERKKKALSFEFAAGRAFDDVFRQVALSTINGMSRFTVLIELANPTVEWLEEGAHSLESFVGGQPLFFTIEDIALYESKEGQ